MKTYVSGSTKPIDLRLKINTSKSISCLATKYQYTYENGEMLVKLHQPGILCYNNVVYNIVSRSVGSEIFFEI